MAIVRQDLLVVRREAERLAADGAMEGAMWTAASRLLEATDQAALVQVATSGTDIIVGSVTVRTRVRLESAKLDLNLADEEQFTAVLRAAGAGDGQAKALAAAIADWRDPDDEVRNGGAEREQYAAQGHQDMPPNRPFLDVSELQAVTGMPPQLYACLRPYLTLYTDGLRADAADLMPMLREAFQSPTGATMGSVSAALPRRAALAIETRIADGDGTDRYARQWIIRLTDRRVRPIEILDRRDLGPIETAAEAACPPGLSPVRP
ncbi:type II secretion system protein GspK [Oleomonas cavernae]|nr:type II secretion system protein GspK [Oleomonas cavernae]